MNDPLPQAAPRASGPSPASTTPPTASLTVLVGVRVHNAEDGPDARERVTSGPFLPLVPVPFPLGPPPHPFQEQRHEPRPYSDPGRWNDPHRMGALFPLPDAGRRPPA